MLILPSFLKQATQLFTLSNYMEMIWEELTWSLGSGQSLFRNLPVWVNMDIL